MQVVNWSDILDVSDVQLVYLGGKLHHCQQVPVKLSLASRTGLGSQQLTIHASGMSLEVVFPRGTTAKMESLSMPRFSSSGKALVGQVEVVTFDMVAMGPLDDVG